MKIVRDPQYKIEVFLKLPTVPAVVGTVKSDMFS